MARQLIQRGARVNDGDRHGRNALWYASSDGGQEAVRLLLDAKAEPDVKDEDGYTPLLRAVKQGCDAVAISCCNTAPAAGCRATMAAHL